MALKYARAGCSEIGTLAFFENTFTSGSGAIAASTSNPNGQAYSLKASVGAAGANTGVAYINNIMGATGGRAGGYIYFDVLPTGNASVLFHTYDRAAFHVGYAVVIGSDGKLRLVTGDTFATVLGTGTTVLAVNTLYRWCLASTITSSVVNECKVYLGTAANSYTGAQEIDVVNATLNTTNAKECDIGWINATSSSGTMNIYHTDIWVDDLTTLADPGDYHVTAKRPFANGTTNSFSTFSTGSGYGSGNASWVNERPVTTSRVERTTSGGADVEEYNAEGAAAGDKDISAHTLIDYIGWVSVFSSNAATDKLLLNGVQTNISTGNTITYYTVVAGSSTYPAGTGTDIGLVTGTTVTHKELEDCGIICLYKTVLSVLPPTLSHFARQAVPRAATH